MKVLVTGGAGFIGSHLSEALWRRGAKVVVVDNLAQGDLKNLAWGSGASGLEFVRADVNDTPSLRPAIEGCEWVFHLAASASVPFSIAEPIRSNSDNLDASLNLLVLARDAGVKRFVLASSSAVYGNGGATPRPEESETELLSPYALQKCVSEKYARQFHRLYGLPTVVLRYFNVFGPRQSFNSSYSGVIARFATGMLEGRAPVIFGDGTQSRDFVYVDNVVAANLLAAERPANQVAGRVFNIGGGRSINLLDLVAELNPLTGQRLSPEFQPSRAGDVLHSLADISLAREFLDYEPLVSWRAGLSRTLDFYRTK
jgi:nucleoside-diphosphate-sugar epimerase